MGQSVDWQLAKYALVAWIDEMLILDAPWDGRSQWNEVTTSVGFASSSDSRVHFGLGANRLIKDIEIRWPSGIKQTLHDVAVDRVMTVEEPRK